MNCHTCGYRLWNLPPGDCPECGRAFKPSDFEFQPNAVQYLCPHCQQQYYGLDENGHLVPLIFDCVRCGQAIHMDQMLLRPDRAVHEERTGRERNPWVDRRHSGGILGWLSTVGQGMVTPPQLMARTPAIEGGADATAFFALTSLVYHVIAAMPMLAFALLMDFMVGGRPSASVGLMFSAIYLVALLATWIGAGLWTATAHGILRLTGDVEHGVGRTWQTFCYTSGANWGIAIPCLGLHLAWIGWCWWAVAAILGLVRAQGVGGVRASISVLLLPIIALIGVGGWIAWFMATTTAAFSGHPSAYAQSQVSDMVSALSAYAVVHGGDGPEHAAALVAEGHVQPWSFSGPPTHTMLNTIPVGSHTLADMTHVSNAERQRMVQDAIAAMPADVIAHRVGDFVFTCHGIDLNQPADPGLWIVVSARNPHATGWHGANELVVGAADGSVHVVRPTRAAVELAAQNQLRAVHGLAPLPPPETVTHQQPATAGSP